MQVKKTLDDALLSAGVQFLFATYATDVLRDEAGNPCGIVMANRAGRQAVVGKVIIDATDRASLARIAGAKAQPSPAGPQTFRRVVIGGEPVSGKDLTARKLPFTLNPSGQDVGKSGGGKGGAKSAVSPDRFDVIEYTLTLPMPDTGLGSFAAAEQLARDMTFHPEQVDESETLFQVPPDPIKARKSFTGAWTGVEALDLDAFRPADVARFYVLGGCADIPREQAGKLLRPLALMDVGARIGSAAADEAKSLPQPKEAKLPGGSCRPVAAGEVREMLSGLRPLAELPTLAAEQRPLPVIGQYDVVVVGGGTSGAPAGIGAARGGAKTLVVEYLHGLGGVSTIGLIGKYYHGYREGFTAEIDKGVAAIDTQRGVNAKMQWYRSELRKAKADIWFGAMGCGALVEKDRIVGVVVATPQGRGVVLAKAVIDGTGNADIAAAGGAPCVYHDGTELAVQGTGLPPRALGASYTNTDYTFADEADMLGVWGLFVYARQKYKNSYDLGQLIDTRERRRIVGEFVINPLDEMNGRTYGDSVVYCMSNFDSHGYTIHPVFFLEMPPHKDIYTYVPYRALLPKGMEGILVVGLAVSAHRDAVPVIRMQPDLQNEGYAAGIAASMAASAGTGLRQVDVKKLQKHLVDIKSLPANVLTDKDSYPIPTEKLAEAVKSLKDNYKGVSVVLTGAEQSLPMLRKAHAEAPGAKERLIYAHVLGMMSDGTGVAELMGAVESTSWDKGWNFKGMGQFGWSVSQLDSFIIALGKTRDRRSLPVLIERARQLDATQEFSHIRAVALAMEYIGDPSAAGVLAELLRKPRMGGHWVTAPNQATTQPDAATRPGVPAERVSTRFEDRNSALREILLARALYRCGDKDGLGKRILSEYANDLRAQFAAHARAVLAGGPK
jgi:flavin-dependent dehydrogenase